MADTKRKERLRLLLLVGIAAPAAMALVGVVLAYLAGLDPLSLVRVPDWRAVLIGAATGLGSMGIVTLLYKSHPSLERALRRSGTRVGLEALESAGLPVMLVVVTGAAFGEEILFRGGFQPLVGLIPAALLFGFSHGGWRKDMLPYAVAASLAGSAFGLAYRLTDNLWVPISAHAFHNVLSTLLLGKRVDVAWEGWVPHIRLLPEPLDLDDVVDDDAEVPPDELSQPDQPEPLPDETDGESAGPDDGDPADRAPE